MDPLVRQASLETLLENHKKISPQELDEALRLGLTDPDLEINQRAWEFIEQRRLHGRYEKELLGYIKHLKQEGSAFSLALAKKIHQHLSAI